MNVPKLPAEEGKGKPGKSFKKRKTQPPSNRRERRKKAIPSSE